MTMKLSWAKRNPEENRRRIREHYQRRREFMAGWKASRGCYLCGEVDPDCLDLHHRDPTQKNFTIGRVALICALDLLIAEMEKCDVLCANCHRKLHARELRERRGA